MEVNKGFPYLGLLYDMRWNNRGKKGAVNPILPSLFLKKEKRKVILPNKKKKNIYNEMKNWI